VPTDGAAANLVPMARLRWQVPERADTPAWLDLLAAIEAADGRGETYTVEDLDDEWASVWSHPATDAVFVWERSELVAFGWLKTQVGTDKGHRVACWGGVRPSCRGRGIGRAVLRWQIERASEVAAGLDPALPTQLGVDAVDQEAALVRLASRFGFQPERRFLEVARSTAAPVPSVAAVDGLTLRPWSAAFDDAARAAHADSFVDHWGSEARTEEEWRQWYTGHRSFRPDLSVVALDQQGGEVVSLVLCAAYPQDWTSGAAPVEAWITTVGTRRAWRGRGVAGWALAEALARVAGADDSFERAILGVDAENPTGARRLYGRLGFEEVRSVTHLAREPLSPDAG
jgi:ribosomal protein S18 acetylase RimI-like enzyme